MFKNIKFFSFFSFLLIGLSSCANHQAKIINSDLIKVLDTKLDNNNFINSTNTEHAGDKWSFSLGNTLFFKSTLDSDPSNYLNRVGVIAYGDKLISKSLDGSLIVSDIKRNGIPTPYHMSLNISDHPGINYQKIFAPKDVSKLNPGEAIEIIILSWRHATSANGTFPYWKGNWKDYHDGAFTWFKAYFKNIEGTIWFKRSKWQGWQHLDTVMFINGNGSQWEKWNYDLNFAKAYNVHITIHREFGPILKVENNKINIGMEWKSNDKNEAISVFVVDAIKTNNTTQWG